MKENKLKSMMLLMVLFFSVSLSAFEVDGIEYAITSETDMTVEVIKSHINSGDLVIPEKITYNANVYYVTGIGKRAFAYLGFTSVNIPNSVKTIGNRAFYGCNELTSITIPNSTTSIDLFAFYGCSNLTSIVVGEGLTSIGQNAFSHCDALSSIKVDSQNKIFDSRDNCNAIIETSTNTLIAGCKNTVIPSSVTSIGEFAFYSCKSITTITIPNNVMSIGRMAFYNCTSLTSIVIPNSVTTIGHSAFYMCDNLASITIPNGVRSIEDLAFCYCKSLASVTIPNSVMTIGNSAFGYCSGLSSITIPNSVTNIGLSCFSGCEGLTSIKVNSQNETYDSRDDCNAIIETSSNTLIAGCKKTVIPHSVTSIGDYAFSGTGLNSIIIPNSVTSIGAFAFIYCSGLSSIVIPNSVTSISESAFADCSGIESITIPNSVTTINEYAFSGCNGLTSVKVGWKEPLTVPSSTFAFLDKSNVTLYVPKGSLAAYEAADVWKEFGNIVEVTESSYLEVADTVGFTGKQLVLPIELKNTDEIAGVQFNLTLPAGVCVALNSKNKLMFSKTERDADHTLSGSKAEDGSYTVLLYSADSEAITGNEGSIIDVTLDIDKEMKDGTYEIKISDIVLSTTKAVKINADDVTAQLEVKSYLLGDPNNDGSIDVVDITMIANHILGNNPENFIFAAADVDADGTVDVNDIIFIANIILYGSSSNAKPSMAKASKHLANNVTSNDSNGDGFTVKNVSVKKGGTVTVDFELTNAAHDFSGIQMDIDLGEGLSFATKSNGKVNVTKGARLEDEDFTLSVAKQEGNQYRALGYYTDGSVIPEKSGTLFSLTLQADDSLADGKTFNCQLNNITLSTKNNEKIQQETQTFTVTIGDATGISELLNEDGTPAVIYDLTGKRIETPAKSGQVIIIKKGGKTLKVFKK